VIHSLNLKEFYNLHEGESCFLFGDGPSVRMIDYSFFTQKIAFTCGMQLFHRDFHKLNCPYYVLIEPFLFYSDWLLWSKKRQYLKKHRLVSNEIRDLIKARRDMEFFLNLTNFFSIRGNNVTFLHQSLLCRDQKFKTFLNNQINPFASSYHSLLSLAMIMGFKKVYLVGFDAYNIKPSPYRWYQKDFDDNPYEGEMIKDPYLEIYCEDIELFNISVEPTKSLANHYSYEEFSGEKATLQDNLSIINNSYIDLMKKRFKDIE